MTDTLTADALVQCQACEEVMPWSKADASCRRVFRETFEHPAEYILICPFCGAEEPSYEVVAAEGVGEPSARGAQGASQLPAAVKGV